MHWIPLMLIALHLGSAQAVGPSELPDLGAVSVASDLLGTDDKGELDYIGQIEAAKNSLNGLADANIEHKSEVIDILTGFVALEPIASKMKDEKFDCNHSNIDHLMSMRKKLKNYFVGRVFSVVNKDRLLLVRLFSNMEQTFLKQCLSENMNQIDTHVRAKNETLKALEHMRSFSDRDCLEFVSSFKTLKSQANIWIERHPNPSEYPCRYISNNGAEILARTDVQGAKPMSISTIRTRSLARALGRGKGDIMAISNQRDSKEEAMNFCEQTCGVLDRDSTVGPLFKLGGKLLGAIGSTEMRFRHHDHASDPYFIIDDYVNYHVCMMTKKRLEKLGQTKD